MQKHIKSTSRIYSFLNMCAFKFNWFQKFAEKSESITNYNNPEILFARIPYSLRNEG